MTRAEIVEKYRKYLYGVSTYYKEPLPFVRGEGKWLEDVDGETRKVQVPSPRALKLVAAGKATKLKVEPPHRQLMAPDVDKKLMVIARSLDLRGESLTGTKMDFCLLSYSTLVECGEGPEHQVMQVEFP